MLSLHRLMGLVLGMVTLVIIISTVHPYPVYALTAEKPVLLALPCDVRNPGYSEADFYAYVNSKTIKYHHDNDGFSIDFRYPGHCKTNVAYAVFSGTIIEVKEDDDNKIQFCTYVDPPAYVKNTNVKIKNSRTGVIAHYIHMDILAANTVKVGQEVTIGDEIGTISDKGCADGEHIHFQLYEPQLPGDKEVVIRYADFQFAPRTAVEHLSPTVSFTQPLARTAVDETALVAWNVEDRDSNAWVSLYLNTQKSTTGGQPISSCSRLSEDSGVRSCSLKVTDYPDREYYVYACVDDDDPTNGSEICSLAPGELVIEHPQRRDSGLTYASTAQDSIQYFTTAFKTPPIVVAQVMTTNEGDPVSVVISHVTKRGFELELVERPYFGRYDKKHRTELISWYAVERTNKYELTGAISDAVHGWTPVVFTVPFNSIPQVYASTVSNNNKGSVSVDLRNVTARGFEYRLESPDSLNPVVSERMNWIALSDRPSAQAITKVSPPNYTPQGQLAWQKVTFASLHTIPPLVIASINSEVESDPAGVRIRNVSTEGFEYVIQEPERPFDGKHNSETIRFLAIPHESSFRITQLLYPQREGDTFSRSIRATFSQPVNSTTLQGNAISLVRSGGDGSFTEGNEVTVPLVSPAQEVTQDLQLIRAQYPVVAGISYRQRWRPGSLTITLSPEASTQFRNGAFSGFDSLNKLYGPVSVSDSRITNTLSFRFTYQYYNMPQLAKLYRKVPGVTEVQVSTIKTLASCASSWSDIAWVADGTYDFTYHWNCRNHKWRFLVHDGHVQLVSETGAALSDKLISSKTPGESLFIAMKITPEIKQEAFAVLTTPTTVRLSAGAAGLISDVYRLEIKGGTDQREYQLHVQDARLLDAVSRSKPRAEGARVQQIRKDLQLIKSAYPHLNGIHYALPWRQGEVLLQLTPEAFARYTSGTYSELTNHIQSWGNAQTRRANGTNRISVLFEYQYYNMQALAATFSTVPGVLVASPNVIKQMAVCQGVRSTIEIVNTSTYRFIYGDYCTPHVWEIRMDNGKPQILSESGGIIDSTLLMSNAVRSTQGYFLDGEKQNSFPSGNGTYGGNWQSLFTIP